MVRDVYGQEKSASVMGYMTVAMMVAPMFGPAIGGFITDNFSWRWMYAGLSFIGALLAVCSWFIMHETRSAQTAASDRTSLLDASKDLLQLRAFNACTIMLSGTVGLYYAFLAGAPFVMMESRGYSASQFGAWFAMVPIGYLTGNLLAGRFSERLGVSRMVMFGAIPGLAGVSLLWVLSFSTHPLSLFIPMNLIALSNGMSLPNLMSAAMSVRSDLVSSAASSRLIRRISNRFWCVVNLRSGCGAADGRCMAPHYGDILGNALVVRTVVMVWQKVVNLNAWLVARIVHH